MVVYGGLAASDDLTVLAGQQQLAAVVVGGVAIRGGAGSVVGVVLGAVTLLIIKNGLILVRVDPLDDWAELTRICFPPPATPDRRVRHDIYPPQQSQVEIELDAYFMRERSLANRPAMEALIASGVATAVTFDRLAGGIDSECFGANGLPPHPSWSAAASRRWHTPLEERWAPISGALAVDIEPPAALPLYQLASFRDRLRDCIRAALDAHAMPRGQQVVWRWDWPATIAIAPVVEALTMYWN